MMNTMRRKNAHPIIRPGQRKPYTKATRREIEQRRKAAALFDYWGWEKSDILWFFQEVFGVEWRQAGRYLRHARTRDGA
jgi:hypothetical protein